MDNWKLSLDKYLTSEPQDEFTPWVEQVYNHYSDEFYNSIDEFEGSETENKWLNKLFNKRIFTDLNEQGQPETFGSVTPKIAAQIIMRAYNIFLKK